MTKATKSVTDCQVLILHDGADSYFEALKRRFPTVQFELCEDAGSIEPLVTALQPQVIFSWKSKSIPHAVQREVALRPEIKWVQVGGTGFDHLQPLHTSNAIFTNCAGVLSQFMAETVLGALLMMNFGFPRYIQQQRERRWEKMRWSSVSDKTVLIIGLGNIGTKVARHAKMVGLHVLGIRRDQALVEGVDEMLSPDQLANALARAHFVCLHVPLTPSTRHLIGASELAQMRPDAVLINTARGGVVDETALIDALKSGQIGGAYLDVFEQEPLPPDNPLWELPNVVISPHISDSVADWEQRFARFFGDNLERWLKGEPLLNIVDVKRGY